MLNKKEEKKQKEKRNELPPEITISMESQVLL
jgi:hypothetical protein